MALQCCEDLIVDDISDKQVEILAPSNNVTITNSTVTLWWNEVEDATSYVVQVVSPSFESAQQLWLDSTVSTNKLTWPLTPGKFEWRVKAINDISETGFVCSRFRIDSTSNLANQTILTSYPLDGSTLNTDSVTFQWSDLYNALSYTVQLRDSSDKLLSELTTQDPHCKMAVSADGVYHWSVYGTNSGSSTRPATGIFSIDMTAPDSVRIISPLNNEFIFTDSVSFKWENPEDSGSALSDSLTVFSENDLSHPIIAKRVSASNYTDTLSKGTYRWTVICIDKAGNKSSATEPRVFSKE